MSGTIWLTLDEVSRIKSFMEKFQKDENSKFEQPFEICSDTSSGIGSTINIAVTTHIGGYEGRFTHEITGVENW